MSTPSVTFRTVVERIPDTGASVDTVIDSDVILPLTIVSGSTTWKADTVTRKVIGASDTDVSFSVTNARGVVVMADDTISLKWESGGVANLGVQFSQVGKGVTPVRSGAWTFLVSGNGSTPANITVFTIAP